MHQTDRWIRLLQEQKRSLGSAGAMTALAGLLGPETFAAAFMAFLVGYWVGSRSGDIQDSGSDS
jgi:hypothetical protein